MPPSNVGLLTGRVLVDVIDLLRIPELPYPQHLEPGGLAPQRQPPGRRHREEVRRHVHMVEPEAAEWGEYQACPNSDTSILTAHRAKQDIVWTSQHGTVVPALEEANEKRMLQ